LEEVLVGVRGVLFDMDGVLLDTESIYTEATIRVLGPLASKYTFQVKQKLMGRAPLIAAKILLEEVGSDLTPEEYNRRKKPILDELFRACRPRTGAPELVRALRERGLPLAVATSSDRAFFETKTAHHEWFSLFDVIVCGIDPGVALHKPAPDIFLEAARRIGVPPSACLVFEDSPAGVEAARRAQVARIIAVPDARLDRGLIAASHYTLDGFEPLLPPNN
jgi:pseudouridine-5'-monophosphatase